MHRHGKSPITTDEWVMTIHGVGRVKSIVGQHAVVEFIPGGNQRTFEYRTLDRATPAEYHVSSARRLFEGRAS